MCVYAVVCVFPHICSHAFALFYQTLIRVCSRDTSKTCVRHLCNHLVARDLLSFSCEPPGYMVIRTVKELDIWKSSFRSCAL